LINYCCTNLCMLKSTLISKEKVHPAVKSVGIPSFTPATITVPFCHRQTIAGPLLLGLKKVPSEI